MRRNADEVVPKSARRDPRAESDSLAPPAPRPEPADEAVDAVDAVPERDAVAIGRIHVGVGRKRAVVIDPRVDRSSLAPGVPGAADPGAAAAAPTVAEAPVQSDPAGAVSPVEVPAASSPRAVVTIVDPRLAEVDGLLARGDWRELARRLGPPDQVGSLPPTLGLLYAIASKESGGDSRPDGVDDNAIAIRCVAGLFGVPVESATALIVAKRILRRNPDAWRARAAPPVRVSVLIMLLAVLIGAAVGLLSTFGNFALP